MSTRDEFAQIKQMLDREEREVEALERAAAPTPEPTSAGREFTPSMDRLRTEYLDEIAYRGFECLYAAEWDRALAAHDTQVRAEAWDEGERHGSEHLATWGQFCPGTDCNPYRARAAEAVDRG